jgi:hypothetical protein
MRREFAVFRALNLNAESMPVNRRPAAEDETRARLAAALRENLKRRKAQARARKVEDQPAQDEVPNDQAAPPRPRSP